MGTIITKGRSFQAQVRKKGHPSITRTFDTRKAAALWITQTEADISRGLYVDRSVAENMTLKKLLIKYGKEVTPDKKSAAKEAYIISRLCRESIVAYSLANLPPDALAAFRDRRLEKVSPATVMRDLALISTAIEHARKNWRVNLVNNPVHLISKPKVKNERKRRLGDLEEKYLRRALTVSDYEGMDYCEPRTENPYVLPAFEFAIESAMRAGELIGIRVGDVYLDESFVRLHDTKNGESRDVPLTTAGAEILEGLISDDADPADKVFGTLTYDALKKVWERAKKHARALYLVDCKEEGTKPEPRFLMDLRWHDLRREAITRLSEDVDTSLELAAISGHKSMQMLKRYYRPKATDLANKINERRAQRAA
jgi:integrase